MVAIPIAIKAAAASGTAATGTAATTVPLQASFASSLKPIGAVLGKLGHGSLFKGIFSTASAAIKSKDASKISADIKAKEKETKDQELSGFGDAWNQCKIETK